MSEHTPGPWTISTKDPFEYAINAINGDPDIHSGSWDELATVYGAEDEGTLGKLKGQANARLIAAAPELLEIVKAIINYDGEDGVTGINALFSIAESIIAKAEGRNE